MSAGESITSLSEAVAVFGALPMSVGPEQKPRTILDRGRDALRARMAKDDLRLVLENVITYAAHLETRVAELEAERHSTNEALDDAVQELRAVKTSDDTYPPALPWAALMDDEDLSDFLDELMDATTMSGHQKALAEVEDTFARWRLIAEAQHGHNTAPGPDAVATSYTAGPEVHAEMRAALRRHFAGEPEGEHYATVHHDYRLGHDLPETGGQR